MLQGLHNTPFARLNNFFYDSTVPPWYNRGDLIFFQNARF